MYTSLHSYVPVQYCTTSTLALTLTQQAGMSTGKSQKTVVIDVPGLSKGLINRNREYAPFLCSFSGDDGPQSFSPAFPALTCTAQATFLTGKGPKDHGITANGWYVCTCYRVVCCP